MEHLVQPGQEPADQAAEPAGERARSGQQGDDHGRLAGARFRLADQQVVGLAAVALLGVDQLAVEQVERGVDDPGTGDGTRRHQAPALVMIINGMVAAATTMMSTRYTEAMAFMKRPFTRSPM